MPATSPSAPEPTQKCHPERSEGSPRHETAYIVAACPLGPVPNPG